MSLLSLYELADRVDPGQTTPVMVFPVGLWHTRKYGDLPFSKATAERIIANFAAKALEQTRPFVDSGHHDEMSPATGWVERVYLAPYKHPESGEQGEALWADVTWNERGAKVINAGEYRYISPVLAKHIITATGEEVAPVLRSLSPTNVPVLRAMPSILEAPEWVAASEAHDDVAIYCSEVTLEPDTDEPAGDPPATGAVPVDPPQSPAANGDGPPGVQEVTGSDPADGQPNPQETKQMKELVDLLQLAEDADEATILAEVERIKTRAETLNTELTELKQSQYESERDAIIDGLIADGHVAPAEKDDLVALADRDFELFKRHAEHRKLRQVIDLAERGRHEDPNAGAEPQDFGPNPSLEVVRLADELRTKENVPFVTAIQRVLAAPQHKELAEAYTAFMAGVGATEE
jgi:hypothetical protein